MPRFVTIGYGDREGYDRTPEPIRAAAHAQDAELQHRGALMGIAGRPVQVRNPQAKGVETADGPIFRPACPSPASRSSRPRIWPKRSTLSPRRPAPSATG